MVSDNGERDTIPKSIQLIAGSQNGVGLTPFFNINEMLSAKPNATHLKIEEIKAFAADRKKPRWLKSSVGNTNSGLSAQI
jgi:hypothetical protein